MVNAKAGAAISGSAGEEFSQVSDLMIGDPGQHLSEPGLRIDALELGRLNERQHHRCTLAAAIGALRLWLGAISRPRLRPRLHREIHRPSCVWQALLDIRNARQEHCFVLVPRIGAKNIFVPMVRGRTMLHDVGGCPQFSWEGP